MEGWGKTKQAAAYAGVSIRTFRKWLKNGLKHSCLPSGVILVKFQDIDEFLENFRRKEVRLQKELDDLLGGL
jgi:hypothetical protein